MEYVGRVVSYFVEVILWEILAHSNYMDFIERQDRKSVV